MTRYKLVNNGLGVIRFADPQFIPCDPTNPDWLAYQDWLNAGGRPDAADDAPNRVHKSTRAG